MSFREFREAADNGSVTSDPADLRAAAFRLKHDLGKAVRWNAPAVREADTETLRRRLGRDLLETRVGPDGRPRSAVEVYEAWLAREGTLFAGDRLSAMSEAIDAIRRRLPRLAELGRNDLVALDDASLRIQEEARALWRDTVASDPEASDEVAP
jgi:hypothetical protein